MLITEKISSIIDSALSAPIKEKATAVVMSALSTPGLQDSIDREIARQARRSLSQEFGVPLDTVFDNVYDFVDEIVMGLYAQQTSSDLRWCGSWWAHPAAMRRLTMMWASWESHRAENPATGEEVWARVVGDYHFKWLTGSYGPFIRCSHGHNPTPQLPSDPIPTTEPAEPTEHTTGLAEITEATARAGSTGNTASTGSSSWGTDPRASGTSGITGLTGISVPRTY